MVAERTTVAQGSSAGAWRARLVDTRSTAGSEACLCGSRFAVAYLVAVATGAVGTAGAGSWRVVGLGRVVQSRRAGFALEGVGRRAEGFAT